MNPCDERTNSPLQPSAIEDVCDTYGWEGCLDALSEVPAYHVPTIHLATWNFTGGARG